MSNELEGMSEAEIQSLAMLAKQLGSNPKTRLKMMALTKEVNPEVSIPELDQMALLGNITKKIDEKFNSIETRDAERDALNKVYQARQRAIKTGAVTDDEIEALEQFMVDNGMTDHAKAAQHFANAKKLAEPAPMQQKYEMPRDHLAMYKTKGMNGMNEAIKNNALQDLRDLRSGKIRIN